MNKQARQLRKQKAKQLKDRQQEQRRSSHRDYLRKYPVFELIGVSGVPPTFAKLVQDALARVDFDDTNRFPPGVANGFAIWKSQGTGGLLECASSIETKLTGTSVSVATTKAFCGLFAHLGQVLFDLIGKEALRPFIPFCNFSLLPERRSRLQTAIRVMFRALLEQKANDGTIYYSRHRPTMVFNERYVVGWSKHALDQLCARMVRDYTNYAGAERVFDFLDENRYYEPCLVGNVDPAFSVFGQCTRHFPSGDYAIALLGPKADVEHCYYRLGYCPVSFEQGFAKAITILYPGFRTTPEHRKLRVANLPSPQKRKWLERAETMTTDGDREETLELARWFHENGVPQIIHSTHNTFRYRYDLENDKWRYRSQPLIQRAARKLFTRT